MKNKPVVFTLDVTSWELCDFLGAAAAIAALFVYF